MKYDIHGLEEYVVLDARFTAKVHPDFTDTDLAALPTNLVTAAVALFDPTCLAMPGPWDPAASGFDYQDASILIVGGGSNTGKSGTQQAALVGTGKIVVIASSKGEADAKALGATRNIDRTKTGVKPQLKLGRLSETT